MVGNKTIFAFLALSGAWIGVSILIGCVPSRTPPSRSAYWGYTGRVDCSNLLGCSDPFADGGRAFGIPEWGILQHDERNIVVYFHSGAYCTTLLLSAKLVEKSPYQPVSTDNGTLKAWLVRMSPSQINSPTLVDQERLIAVATGRGDANSEGNPYLLSGEAEFKFDGQRILECSVNLHTQYPIPLYSVFLQNWIPAATQFDKNEVDRLRYELAHPKNKQAMIKGRFVGAWFDGSPPPI